MAAALRFPPGGPRPGWFASIIERKGVQMPVPDGVAINVSDDSAPPTRPGGVLLQLRAKMPSLRAGERKIAHVILNQPEEVRRLSILNLAERGGVSEATVMRLCYALGFRGYTDLKVHLIEDLAASQAAETALVGETYADVQEGDTLDTIVHKVLRQDMQALRDTSAVLDIQQIAAAVGLLTRARRVECYGVGGSGPVVQDTAYRLLCVGVTASACTDSHLQVVQASLLGPQDVALCVSHTGETRDTLDALLVAQEAGARTIAVTSFPQSPIAQAAAVLLLTAAVGSRWRSDAIPTRIAQLSLIDALCVAIKVEQGAKARAVVEKITGGLARKQR